VAANDDYILDLLVESSLINASQARAARQAAPSGVIAHLISEGAVTEEDITRAVAANSAMEFMDLAHVNVPLDVVALLRREDAYRFRAIPLGQGENGIVVAIEDPLNFDVLDSITHLLDRDIEFVCATPRAMSDALMKYYGTAEDAARRIEDELGDIFGADDAAGDLEGGDTGDAPIIKMVTLMLVEAYKLRASDIHLEPMDRRFRIRFRIDGVLQEMQNPPKKLQSAILARLKIMTGTMNIDEKRLPQDGRIQVKLGKKQLDLRVSTIPTAHGESIVMRILDKSSLSLGLPQLGFLSDDQANFEQLISLPDGILLVTGPTGSGKTTTLYACLNYINKPDRKLITVEDPVEYQMAGINQVQVNTDVGMTFPAALRSILRQAPNIIMIGEIRDGETANIAINASLTGHLVFSTLHTNDAPGAVARLVDIGVQPFLVSSAVRAIVAQRLVRKICSKCGAPSELNEGEVQSLGVDAAQLAEATIRKGIGCDNCKHSGYRGRMGLFEIFNIDDEVRHMVNQRANTVELRKRAREMGMRTLREDGIRKVLSGMTTAEEVISVSMGDSD
jgi:type II secretory ATPase GspE/PulE/Tfp pilus assembly ATPase PilB-like protein